MNTKHTITVKQEADLTFTLKLKGTAGKLLAVLHALELSNTPLSNELYDGLRKAMQEAKILT